MVTTITGSGNTDNTQLVITGEFARRRRVKIDLVTINNSRFYCDRNPLLRTRHREQDSQNPLEALVRGVLSPHEAPRVNPDPGTPWSSTASAGVATGQVKTKLIQNNNSKREN